MRRTRAVYERLELVRLLKQPARPPPRPPHPLSRFGAQEAAPDEASQIPESWEEASQIPFDC
ncbi:MAG: hypothetical protein AB1758_08805 [Candidatus Eremiobacterota bacterium]